MQYNLLDKKSDLLATPDMNRKRYTQIDYAKALGILLVVFGHFVEEFNKKTLGSELGNYVFNWIYSFHMPLFFILSGLGLFFKYQNKQITNYLSEIKYYAKRLLLPYCIWSCIYILASIIPLAFVYKKPFINILLEEVMLLLLYVEFHLCGFFLLYF